MVATVAPFISTLPLVEVMLTEASIPRLPLLAPLIVMVSRAKIALSSETPIEAVAKLANLLEILAVTKPDTLVPDVAPNVLSSVIVPGNTMEVVPIKLGSMLAPADLAMKLIAELEVLAEIVKLPAAIEESLVPVVVS